MDYISLMNEPKSDDVVKKRRLRLMKQSTVVILVGIAIMASITVYIIKQSPSMKEVLDAERPVARDTIVHLAVFEKQTNGESRAVSGNVKPGAKLVFELSSNMPVHVALLAAINNEAPEVLYKGAKIPPGKNKRLAKAEERFVYQVEPGPDAIKFCLVQANNAAALMTKLQRLNNIWLRLPESQCVQITTD